METFNLGKDFMLGTATSSAQIEGGDKNNTWYQWCEEGRVPDPGSCYTACDHWNRVEQDTEFLKKLNVDTHRMSIEWSRIEPTPGEFSHEVILHYRNEIQLLIDNHIKPLVTLHHFSEPLWFQGKGGWTKPANSDYFIRYVRYVIENLGDLVCDWVTFNEPNVYALLGYATGCYPPGVRNIITCDKVLSEIIKTHVKIYDLIHTIRKEKNFKGKTMVGAAIHIRIFDGITIFGKIMARVADYVFNQLSLEGMTTGKLKFPISRKGYKYKKGVYSDFLGINYYTRNIIEFVLDPSNYFHKIISDKDLDKTDLGWDIYPEGIYRVSKRYFSKYGIPIYITENGISDKIDNRRPDFIADHLAWLAKSIQEGAKVERYYHWTLMDNFEWLNADCGYFGLYKCNFETQERTPRPSAALFAQICDKKELTEQMINSFNLDINTAAAEIK